MSILSICTQAFLSAAKCLFFSGGGGGGLTSGTYFFDLLLLFRKIALLSSYFTHLRVFNTEFFPRPLHSLEFNKLTNVFLFFFFREHAAKHQLFNFNPKGLSDYLVLLSQLLSCLFSLEFIFNYSL